jgi:hypothetical protein
MSNGFGMPALLALQNLEKKYGGEFFCGLPVPEFQWGLIWRYQSPPKQRFGFPTWS